MHTQRVIRMLALKRELLALIDIPRSSMFEIVYGKIEESFTSRY
jgi:hypothetical protein